MPSRLGRSRGGYDPGPVPMAEPPRYAPADLSHVRTRPIAGRKNLVTTGQFARAVGGDAPARELIASLPDVLAAKALRALAGEVARSVKARRPVVAAFGGHVVKTGCGPLVVDLLQRGVLAAVAMNGGAAIHDAELALVGGTSEDVADGLVDGSFGTAEETGALFAEAAARGAKGPGLGRALGEILLERRAPHAATSVLAAAARLRVPATVHVAPGADTVHIHPKADGAAIGAATFADFRLLVAVVSDLEGGVWLNLGSAVALPEVFLKALTAARNLGRRVEDFAAADLDMLRHYRPRVNVVERPPRRGWQITGPHEILLPLLRVAVLDALGEGREAPRRKVRRGR